MKKYVVERVIHWGDLDALGIVFYPRYYEWMDASAHLLFDSIQLNLYRLWQERNILFGLAETSCRYFQPGRYQQEIEIVTHMENLNEKTMVLRHNIKHRIEGSMMVEGIEKRICMDVSSPDNLHAIDIPDDIYSILEDATR